MRGQGLSIEVAVDTLIHTLETNRAKHIKDYQSAKKGWKKVLAKDLAKLLDDVQADKSIEPRRLQLQSKPQHYVGEYDEAIEMLKFAANPIIELDQQQFRAYVKDEWSWKNTWEASTTSYIAAANL
jgi:hypothetical protein